MLERLIKDLKKLGNKEKAKILSRFFKTGKGDYGEGDIFLGITVPEQRKIAIKYKNIDLKDAEYLMLDKIHEFRLTAILILVQKFQSGNNAEKKEIIDFYLKNNSKINNWDLVDLSADKILGAHLIDKDRSILYKLAESKNVWKRRIAIISTFHLIKNNKFEDTMKISKLLLGDRHDLIQKAVGWMLREVGKKDRKMLLDFLDKHYKEVPRTMLRYSIEKFNDKERMHYLKN